ncbi:hypothetical protein DFJ74DRAFT_159141 [Hyaloraphidium curvatum]|nr:hypothetical protein DFJ74DRAFT_159141 [Hyaloraphidium curvatum]
MGQPPRSNASVWRRRTCGTLISVASVAGLGPKRLKLSSRTERRTMRSFWRSSRPTCSTTSTSIRPGRLCLLRTLSPSDRVRVRDAGMAVGDRKAADPAVCGGSGVLPGLSGRQGAAGTHHGHARRATGPPGGRTLGSLPRVPNSPRKFGSFLAPSFRIFERLLEGRGARVPQGAHVGGADSDLPLSREDIDLQATLTSRGSEFATSCSPRKCCLLPDGRGAGCRGSSPYGGEHRRRNQRLLYGRHWIDVRAGADKGGRPYFDLDAL